MKFVTTSLVLMLVQLLSVSANAWEASNVDRVVTASSQFVERFNLKDSQALGALYKRNSVLKLPGALAIKQRENIVAAWQGGFDAGLDFLVLAGATYTELGARQVLETGPYELTIQTPNGPIVQTGTFAVLWRVPENPNKSPKIVFDTIDAD